MDLAQLTGQKVSSVEMTFNSTGSSLALGYFFSIPCQEVPPLLYDVKQMFCVDATS